MNLRQAVQMALEALEETATCPKNWPLQYEKEEKAITALRAALAEPEQPAAIPDWFDHAFPSGELEAVGFHMPTPRAYAEEMYKRWRKRFDELSSPPQRKPLTDDEIEELCWTELDRRLLSFARAIEAAHGIKE